MADQAALGATGEDGEAEGKKEVFEEFEVSGHRGAADFALAGDFADVEGRGVREGGGFEEAREAADVADQSLGADYLLDVEGGVGGEGGVGIGGGGDGGDGAVGERAGEVEADIRFGGGASFIGPAGCTAPVRRHRWVPFGPVRRP